MMPPLLQVPPSFFSLDSSAPPDVLGGWIACFLTLAVFSFLYRDNPFYKLAEHVFIGLGTAYFALQYYEQGVLQKLQTHIVDASVLETVKLGGHEVPADVAIGLRAAAVVLSGMLLLRLVAPSSWAPRWPLAIMVGVYAALKMTGETQSKLVLLVGNSIQPIVSSEALPFGPDVRIEQTALWFTATKLIYYIGLICVLGHFVFTFRRTRTLAAVSRIGVVTLMITFGSMFGFTVLGRIALLIERVAMLKDYTAPEYALAGGTQAGLLATVLSPPVLLTVLMVALLALGALRRRERSPGPA